MYDMEKKEILKNFDDILKFLSEDPGHIISQLKKKKKFIQGWIEVFLKEKPIIQPSAKYIDSKEYYPSWTNDFFKLASKICQECTCYNHNCLNNKEKQKCINSYYDIIKLQSRRIAKVNEQTLKQIKQKLIRVLEGNEEYVSDKIVYYSTEINSGKFDTRKIRERFTALYKSQNKDQKEENKIIRDTKRYIHEFPLIESDIDRNASYFEEEFNDIIRLTENHDKENNYVYDKIQRSAFIYVSLFYLFFWDFLNNMKLRDCPSANEVESKTDEREIWKAETNIIQRPKDKTPEEVEKEANQIELPNLDHSYKKTHDYLFKHEKVSIEKIFEFSDKILSLISYQKLSSISHKDFPDDVQKMLRKMIEKKIMLKVPLISDGRGNLDYRKCEEYNLKSYFTYQSYVLLFNFLYSATGTKLRNTDAPKISKTHLQQLIKEIKNQKITEKNTNKISLKKIIEELNMGANSTVSDELNRLIEEHDDFDERIPSNGRAKNIIANATDVKNERWIKKLYSKK